MQVRFKTSRIQRLYCEEHGSERYGEAVVKAFFEAVAVLSAARDERDIYALKGFRFEKLRGTRFGQHSIRLNRQWRLVFEVRRDEGKYLLIIDIEDYHQ